MGQYIKEYWDLTSAEAINNCNDYSQDQFIFEIRNSILRMKMNEIQFFVGSEYCLIELTLKDNKTGRVFTRKF